LKEIQDILAAYRTAQNLGIKAALATVVHVEGSAYRRAGARMLITDDGRLTGAISGGCLEGDALRKARLVMAQQKPMLVVYDTNDEDDAKLGVQLGCNGIIRILIEPISPDLTDNPIRFFTEFLAIGKTAVLITIFNMASKFDTQYGTCLLLQENKQTFGTLPKEINPLVLDDAFNVLQAGNGTFKTYNNQSDFTCFIEILLPAIDLVVIGAGNDVVPLVQMAKMLGWQVTVVDGRPSYNTPDRFPTADAQVIARPDEVLARLKPGNRTVFMLMTHNYNYDLALMKDLLHIQTAYIGVLGPKKRLNRMLEEIGGADLVSNKPDHIYGPAGLDIGSETPEQIALSILSQIQAVMNNREATPLRDKPVIHDRDAEQVVLTP
jgi:xanthine dehydrogenase accessory factor